MGAPSGRNLASPLAAQAEGVGVAKVTLYQNKFCACADTSAPIEELLQRERSPETESEWADKKERSKNRQHGWSVR